MASKQEDHDVVLAWAAQFARDAYRGGKPPSAILRELKPVFCERLHYFSGILFVATFRDAFELSLAECKEASEFWEPDEERLVADEIDGYLTPRIEERRASWEAGEVNRGGDAAGPGSTRRGR
jgi:hypothetical protein